LSYKKDKTVHTCTWYREKNNKFLKKLQNEGKNSKGKEISADL
jgi:hypothetical protein